MEFGEKLKQIRIASHMSQEQLADITGLERKTILQSFTPERRTDEQRKNGTVDQRKQAE